MQKYGYVFDEPSHVSQIYELIDAPTPKFSVSNYYHSTAQREVAHSILAYIAIVAFGMVIGCHTASSTSEFVTVIVAGSIFASLLLLFGYHEARRAYMAEVAAEKDALAASLVRQRRAAVELRRKLESSPDGIRLPEYRFLVNLMDAIDNPPASH